MNPENPKYHKEHTWTDDISFPEALMEASEDVHVPKK